MHRLNQRKKSSPAILTAQMVLRIETDIKKLEDKFRDGKHVLDAFQKWRTGLRRFDEAFGLTPAARKYLAKNEIALAALALSRGMPSCNNGLLGAARALACQEKCDAYFWSGRWQTDLHKETRPEGSDGDCWTLIVHNGKRLPSVEKLRKISTENIEKMLVQNSSGITSGEE